MSQTSYSLEQEKAFAGLKAHSVSPQEVLSYVAEGDIVIGTAVMLGTDPDTQVMSPATDTNFLGVALHDQARESQRDSNEPTIMDKDAVSVMSDGAVWVEVTEAVTAGQPAHYNTTNGKFTTVGGTTPSTNAVGSYQTSASANELAVLNIRSDIL